MNSKSKQLLSIASALLIAASLPVTTVKAESKGSSRIESLSLHVGFCLYLFLMVHSADQRRNTVIPHAASTNTWRNEAVTQGIHLEQHGKTFRI